jgi:hypothetical protein
MQTAFLLFESDLEIDPVRSTPSDLLKAFALAHGEEMTFGGVGLGKFCLYKTVPGHAALKFQTWGARQLVSFMFRFDSKRDLTEIAVAFSIDKSKYEESLRKKGIIAPPRA